METFVPDNLFGGVNADVVSKGIVIASGAGVLVRGSVLGKISLTIDNGVAGTNTGNGTVSGVGIGKGAVVGAYKIKCITTATNGGTFSVIDPNGYRLADAVVGTAYAGPIHFTINDGTADFAANDSFTITVSAPTTDKYVLVNSANADGSQVPDCILGEAVDATSADAAGGAYFSGEFNQDALAFGGTDTAATHAAAMRDKGLYLRETVSA